MNGPQPIFAFSVFQPLGLPDVASGALTLLLVSMKTGDFWVDGLTR